MARFQCPKCERTFNKPNHLARHMSVHEKKAPPPKPDKPLAPQKQHIERHPGPTVLENAAAAMLIDKLIEEIDSRIGELEASKMTLLDLKNKKLL